MTLTTLQSRITTELAALGGLTSAADLCKDALAEFCRRVEPDISASISIVSGTSQYSIPSTIDKPADLRDASGNKIVYSLDEFARTITLDQEPTASATYTMYGPPRAVRTNADTVLAALDDNYEDVLWQFVRAHCLKAAHAASFQVEYQLALSQARELRYYRNRIGDASDMPIRLKDSTGQVIADSAAVDGLLPNIDDFLEQDLE